MNHVTVAFLFNQRFDVQSRKASTQKKCRKLSLKLVRITFQMHYMKVAPRNFGLGTEIVVVGISKAHEGQVRNHVRTSRMKMLKM